MATGDSHLAESRLSSFEVKGLSFYRALLVRNDLFICSVQNKLPDAVDTCRKLLAPGYACPTLQRVAGVRTQGLSLLLETIVLEAWRGEQQKKGNLSIRELMRRAEELEREAKQEIQKLAALMSHCKASSTAVEAPSPLDVRTYVLLHAIIT